MEEKEAVREDINSLLLEKLRIEAFEQIGKLQLAADLQKLESFKDDLKSALEKDLELTKKQGELTDEERRAMYAEKYKDGSGVYRPAPTAEEKEKRQKRMELLLDKFSDIEPSPISDFEENQLLTNYILLLRRYNTFLKSRLKSIGALVKYVDDTAGSLGR